MSMSNSRFILNKDSTLKACSIDFILKNGPRLQEGRYDKFIIDDCLLRARKVMHLLYLLQKVKNDNPKFLSQRTTNRLVSYNGLVIEYHYVFVK